VTDPDATCWTLVRGAAGGDPAARDRFGRAYLPVVRAYLAARWRAVPRPPDADDVTQDVFVECFKAGGVLDRVDADRPGGFRAFLLGVARNVARRHEDRGRPPGPLPAGLPAEDTGPAEAFDRAWARTLVRQAARVQADRATTAGGAAVRRVELLRLRFQDGQPIRDIAGLWGVDPAALHREYAAAREEFRGALRAVVAFHHPGAAASEIDRACGELLGLLG
jgi:RNA polymerase sigma-70 factor (ECF subfamily)